MRKNNTVMFAASLGGHFKEMMGLKKLFPQFDSILVTDNKAVVNQPEIKKINVLLDIIGGYNDEYKSILDATIKEEGLEENVKFYGRKPFAFIADILRKSHYYLFPSAEANEGHSNSLTEAMGCGVVPIVSTAGFNASICGNADLVAKDLMPETYAGIIKKIENERQWKKYSEFCYNRVLDNYTQSIVKTKLISYVMPLFKNDNI